MFAMIDIDGACPPQAVTRNGFGVGFSEGSRPGYLFKVLASIVFAFGREYEPPALDSVEGTFQTETSNHPVT